MPKRRPSGVDRLAWKEPDESRKRLRFPPRSARGSEMWVATISSDRMRTKRPLREPVRDAPGPKPKNYITPAGLQRLKDEHAFLLNRERPAVTQVVAWAASN